MTRDGVKAAPPALTAASQGQPGTGSTTDGTGSTADASKPPAQPIWMDLRGSRLLVHASVLANALPQDFVAVESAGAEQVMTELLGVRRVSEAEAYRCEL